MKQVRLFNMPQHAYEAERATCQPVPSQKPARLIIVTM